MKRFIALVMILVFVCFSASCGEKIDNTKLVERYKSIVLEYVNSSDIKTAKEVLEEGIELTDSEELKALLEELTLNEGENLKEAGEEETAEPTEDTTVKNRVTHQKEAKPTTPPLVMDTQTVSMYLENQKTFTDFDTKQQATLGNLSSINTMFVGSPSEYAVFDIDGDGESELLVRYDKAGDTAILDIRNGVCTSYYMPFRGASDIKTDGTMGWSNGTADSGTQKISFTDAGIVEKKVIVLNGLDGIFTINGVDVTEQECFDALAEHDEKASITWNYVY